MISVFKPKIKVLAPKCIRQDSEVRYKRPWGLCHGAVGNGYALLKLFSLTQDELWLERARKFAMHAIIQSQQAEAEYKQIRTDAWCGDIRLALYLHSCLELDDKFPMLDYL